MGHVVLTGQDCLGVEEVTLEKAVGLGVALVHLQHLVFIGEKTFSLFRWEAPDIFGGSNFCC